MACCAFAVFLAMQLLIPFRWLSAFIFGKPMNNQNAPNLVVDWSPHGISPGEGATVAVKPMFVLPRITLKTQIAWILVLELALGAAALGGVAYLWPANAAAFASPAELALFDPLHGVICGRNGLTTKSDIP